MADTAETRDRANGTPSAPQGPTLDSADTKPTPTVSAHAPQPAVNAPQAWQEETIARFTTALGSSAPTPGGGGASALAGALAAALAEMVAQLTVGRARFQAAEAASKKVLTQAQGIRDEMLRLIDDDVRAYGKVKAAYSQPRKTPEQKAAREAALQQALIEAMQPPLQIMDLATEVVVLAGEIATVGNETVASDAGCAAVLGDAAARAAALNVMANLVPLKDCSEKTEAAERIRKMRGRITALRLQALTRVFDRMGLRPEVPTPEELEGTL